VVLEVEGLAATRRTFFLLAGRVGFAFALTFVLRFGASPGRI
jgi:hypothetical protein